MQTAEEGGIIGVYSLQCSQLQCRMLRVVQMLLEAWHPLLYALCNDLSMLDTLPHCMSIASPALQAAVAEAAFMTGMERNSPTVRMASYAPLFVNTHNRAWGPDAIVFNTRKAYGIPSYYVQQMFAESMGIAYASSSLRITFGDVHSLLTAASTTCLDSACEQLAIKVGVHWTHKPECCWCCS